MLLLKQRLTGEIYEQKLRVAPRLSKYDTTSNVYGPKVFGEF